MGVLTDLALSDAVNAACLGTHLLAPQLENNSARKVPANRLSPARCQRQPARDLGGPEAAPCGEAAPCTVGGTSSALTCQCPEPRRLFASSTAPAAGVAPPGAPLGAWSSRPRAPSRGDHSFVLAPAASANHGLPAGRRLRWLISGCERPGSGQGWTAPLCLGFVASANERPGGQWSGAPLRRSPPLVLGFPLPLPVRGQSPRGRVDSASLPCVSDSVVPEVAGGGGEPPRAPPAPPVATQPPPIQRYLSDGSSGPQVLT